MLKNRKINFICKNTEEFLKDEEVDIHGISNLSEHKIIRFKYPNGTIKFTKYSIIVIHRNDNLFNITLLKFEIYEN